MSNKDFSGGWRKRPKYATPQKALEYRNAGVKIKDMANSWNISVQQVHTLIRRAKMDSLPQMTPQEKDLSRALDCCEWLRQFALRRYSNKELRKFNIYVRGIRQTLEREIPCQIQTGSGSAVESHVRFASTQTGAQSERTGKLPVA